VQLAIPDPSLVILVGPSGSGKSTFAQANFRPTEIVSSDALRAMLTDDPGDQGASGEAFAILAQLLHGRLSRRLLTVIDATNLRPQSRRRWLRLAARYDLPAVAVVFDLSDQLFQAHNLMRPDRQVGRDVVSRQTELLRQALAAIPEEGFSRFHVLREPIRPGTVAVERVRG
jgi:protein phosphatase